MEKVLNFVCFFKEDENGPFKPIKEVKAHVRRCAAKSSSSQGTIKSSTYSGLGRDQLHDQAATSCWERPASENESIKLSGGSVHRGKGG